MKALANKWYVYYVEDDSEDMSNLPWDEQTLVVNPKNNEIEPGTPTLVVQRETGYYGWQNAPNFIEIADWNTALPPESYKYFIRACFEEM